MSPFNICGSTVSMDFQHQKQGKVKYPHIVPPFFCDKHLRQPGFIILEAKNNSAYPNKSKMAEVSNILYALKFKMATHSLSSNFKMCNFKRWLRAKYCRYQLETNLSKSAMNTNFRWGIINFCQLFHLIANFENQSPFLSLS